MKMDRTYQVRRAIPQKHSQSLWKSIVRNKVLLFMFLPGFFILVLFHYGPMYGLQIAFKDYSIGLGIWDSPWVGLKHFEKLFTDSYSLNVIKNTVEISLLKLICGFPAPILLSLIINEIGNEPFKKIAQTISYLPHFLSWIIIGSIFIDMLSPSSGIVNYIISLLGMEPIYFMTKPVAFRITLIISSIWKEVGWGTVVYLANISSIDVSLYEAAIADGASRMRRIRHITLPSIMPVACIMLILSMGNIMSAGFDQVFNMSNQVVLESTDIIDTYVYRIGLTNFSYSFSTAVGLFKSVIGLIMVMIVNMVTKKLSDEDYGLW